MLLLFSPLSPFIPSNFPYHSPIYVFSYSKHHINNIPFSQLSLLTPNISNIILLSDSLPKRLKLDLLIIFGLLSRNIWNSLATSHQLLMKKQNKIQKLVDTITNDSHVIKIWIWKCLLYKSFVKNGAKFRNSTS